MPVAVGLVVALTLFFPAFFGDDQFNVVAQPEVETLTSFFTHAPPGTIYVALTGAPTHAKNARYNQFPVVKIFQKKLGKDPIIGPGIADALARRAFHRHGRAAREPAYIVVAPSMLAYSKAYRILPPSSFSILLASLSHSPSWRLVRNHEGTVIYELVHSRRPAVGSLPPGAPG